MTRDGVWWWRKTRRRSEWRSADSRSADLRALKRHGDGPLADAEPRVLERRSEIGRVEDELRSGRAQPIDRLLRQGERCRQLVEEVAFGLVRQRLERDLDRVDVGVGRIRHG